MTKQMTKQMNHVGRFYEQIREKLILDRKEFYTQGLKWSRARKWSVIEAGKTVLIKPCELVKLIKFCELLGVSKDEVLRDHAKMVIEAIASTTTKKIF